MKTTDYFLTVEEYSKLMKMNRKSVYHMIEKGRMDPSEYKRSGKSVRVKNPLLKEERDGVV